MQLSEGALLGLVGGRLDEVDDQRLACGRFLVAAAQSLLATFRAEQAEELDAARSLAHGHAIGVLLAESFELHPALVLAFARSLSRRVLALSLALLSLCGRESLGALGRVALLVVVAHEAAFFGPVSKQPRSLQIHHLAPADEPAVQQLAFGFRFEARAGSELFAAGAELEREARVARAEGDAQGCDASTHGHQTEHPDAPALGRLSCEHAHAGRAAAPPARCFGSIDGV